jgi:hypothetical protein
LGATTFDVYCEHHACEFVEDTLERVYMFVAFMMLVVAYR